MAEASSIEALFKAEVEKCGVTDYDESLLEYVSAMAHELLSDEANAADDNLGECHHLQPRSSAASASAAARAPTSVHLRPPPPLLRSYSHPSSHVDPTTPPLGSAHSRRRGVERVVESLPQLVSK